MIQKYLGKRHQKCQMCHETYTYSHFFSWRGVISDIYLEICLKCAQRENGSSKKQRDKLKELYE